MYSKKNIVIVCHQFSKMHLADVLDGLNEKNELKNNFNNEKENQTKELNFTL